ncbi:hypothetical protein VNO80_14459 [Phaseolus coccineus]|uniref:Glutathione S-transferase n=1 Tax=Phaseolus coccineus TaxID=3886 RepID=A0AAN9MIB5_PHACN
MAEKCTAIDYQQVLYAVWGATVAEGEEEGKVVDAALESLAFLEKEIEGKKYFGGDKIGYLDIAAGWMSHWLSVLEELGDMELLNAERFPSLHHGVTTSFRLHLSKIAFHPGKVLLNISALASTIHVP